MPKTENWAFKFGGWFQASFIAPDPAVLLSQEHQKGTCLT